MSPARRRTLIVAGVVAVAVAAVAVREWLRKRDGGTPAVTVASIAPLTGGAAELGKYNREASELAVRDLAAGPGSRWDLVVEDSKSTPKDGVLAVKSVLARTTPKIFLVHQGAVSTAVTPEVAKSGALLFYIGATEAPKADHPLAFRIYPDPGHVARQTVKQILARSGAKRLAVFWANDEFGAAVRGPIREAAAQGGMTVVFDEPYTPTATDFRTTLEKPTRDGADALYVVGVGAPLGRILSQARQAGFRGLIVSGPELQFTDALTVAGPAAEGAQYLDISYDADADAEPTKSFVARYRDAYGAKPTAAAAIVYDAWTVAARAMGSDAGMTPEALAAAVVRLGRHDGVSGGIEITPQRDFVYTLVARTIRDGKPVRNP